LTYPSEKSRSDKADHRETLEPQQFFGSRRT
jgi:hypothetical protein